MTNSTVLVTGGAGAIGSALCRTLRANGCTNIIVVDDLSSGYREHIPSDITFIHGSIIDDAVLTEAFSQPIDYVFHLAAQFANQNSIEHPISDLMVNGVGTLQVLEKARAHGVRRFVYASSSCVYGAQEVPLREDMAPGVLETPYAVSKWTGEEYVRLYQRLYGTPTVILRYFNSFGPGELPGRYRNVIPNFIATALSHEAIVVTGTGKETRDFTFVDTVAQGTIAAAVSDKTIGGVYNIGSGQEMEIGAVAACINTCTGNTTPVAYAERRSWDNITRRVADISKAKRDFNYAPPTQAFDAYIEETIHWIKQRI